MNQYLIILLIIMFSFVVGLKIGNDIGYERGVEYVLENLENHRNSTYINEFLDKEEK